MFFVSHGRTNRRYARLVLLSVGEDLRGVEAGRTELKAGLLGSQVLGSVS